eukprot:CAMPEP_0184291670 /NCGR_PEP_ID=MMETSP1049-20130417/3617_1 /TAXON_ID=77928 /ORGANISM="Proteomonas sulcata, Strain CCMP704" /LENGTH=87 /DNA_ID=CAMNT_0026599175 /DNA_START=703 /DNA_END=966 /DNA_ORIENTATION=+
MRSPKLVRMMSLDDAPWTWGAGIEGKSTSWNSDMPEFFQQFSGQGSDVYFNIYDELDTSPISWHISPEPVDPTEYQNEWLGSVINIY